MYIAKHHSSAIRIKTGRGVAWPKPGHPLIVSSCRYRMREVQQKEKR